MILIIDNRYANKQKPGNNQNKDLVNENIRFPEVLVIGPDGEQLGVMSSREAQFKANEYDLDLMCVAPNAKPPVCKIINYSKWNIDYMMAKIMFEKWVIKKNIGYKQYKKD